MADIQDIRNCLTDITDRSDITYYRFSGNNPMFFKQEILLSDDYLNGDNYRDELETASNNIKDLGLILTPTKVNNILTLYVH